MSSHFSSLILSCGALLFLFTATACQEKDEADGLPQLQEDLLRLEKKIAEKQNSLDQALARHREAQTEAQVVGDIRAGLRANLIWEDSGPLLTGHLRNDSSFPISTMAVEVSRSEGPNVVERELLTVRFDPILLPGSEKSFSTDASPFIWGFQKQQGPRAYHYLLKEAVLATGETVQDNFAAARERERELSRQKEALLQVRLQHGQLYQEIAEAQK